MNDVQRATGMKPGLVLAVFLLMPIAAGAQPPVTEPSPTPLLTDQEMERFLQNANVIKSRSAGKGDQENSRQEIRRIRGRRSGGQEKLFIENPLISCPPAIFQALS